MYEQYEFYYDLHKVMYLMNCVKFTNVADSRSFLKLMNFIDVRVVLCCRRHGS